MKHEVRVSYLCTCSILNVSYYDNCLAIVNDADVKFAAQCNMRK
jgi:hypothetical protein